MATIWLTGSEIRRLPGISRSKVYYSNTAANFFHIDYSVTLIVLGKAQNLRLGLNAGVNILPPWHKVKSAIKFSNSFELQGPGVLPSPKPKALPYKVMEFFRFTMWPCPDHKFS